MCERGYRQSVLGKAEERVGIVGCLCRKDAAVWDGGFWERRTSRGLRRRDPASADVEIRKSLLVMMCCFGIGLVRV